jgi:hypothetical protein
MKRTDGSEAGEVLPFEEIAEGIPRGASLWFGDRGMIVVTFDQDDQVDGMEHARGRRSAPDWWLAIENWMGIGG